MNVLLLNAGSSSLKAALMESAGGGAAWRRWIDTGLDSPNDIVPWRDAAAVQGHTDRAERRSVVMLFTGGKE